MKSFKSIHRLQLLNIKNSERHLLKMKNLFFFFKVYIFCWLLWLMMLSVGDVFMILQLLDSTLKYNTYCNARLTVIVVHSTEFTHTHNILLTLFNISFILLPMEMKRERWIDEVNGVSLRTNQLTKNLPPNISNLPAIS